MGHTVTFQRPDGQKLQGYLAEPASPAGRPGIVVIQEWWGLNEQIRGVADQLAGQGYRALVPDLYRGKSTVEAAEAEHLMTNLNFGDAAGQATPWACMGVEPALLNGQLCGQVAVRAFRRGDLSRSGLQDYEKMWFARNGAGYRKAVMLADLEWQRGEAAWDHTLNQLDRLSGPEMLNSLRYNTPAFSLPLIWGLLVYDRLGLIRRGLRDRLWVRWGSAQLRRDDGR